MTPFDPPNYWKIKKEINSWKEKELSEKEQIAFWLNQDKEDLINTLVNSETDDEYEADQIREELEELTQEDLAWECANKFILKKDGNGNLIYEER